MTGVSPRPPVHANATEPFPVLVQDLERFSLDPVGGHPGDGAERVGLGRWERSWLLATAAPGRWAGSKDLVVVDGLIGRWGVAG
jgi:hypothetical protein